MKKIVSLLLAVALVGGLFAGCAKKAEPAKDSTPTPTAEQKKETPKIKIGLATDEGGKGDKSFNDSAIAGVERIEKEFAIKPVILESKQNDQYEPNLKNLSNTTDLVFAVGFKMADATKKVAEANPDKKFAIIDSEVKLPNVSSILFREEQGSFLMGVIAAKTSKSGKIGFIGGIDMPLIQKFEAGFVAGVKSINPAAAADLESRKNVKYAGNFSDSAKGYELAKSLYSTGIDVIYHVSGAVGLGLFKAAAEMKKFAIGVDADQALAVVDTKTKQPLYKDVILVSMMKRVDLGTYNTSVDTINGKFQGGKTIIMGLKENGVGLSETINPAVTKDTLDLVEKYKQAIIAGTLVVPTNAAEGKAFKPVEVK